MCPHLPLPQPQFQHVQTKGHFRTHFRKSAPNLVLRYLTTVLGQHTGNHNHTIPLSQRAMEVWACAWMVLGWDILGLRWVQTLYCPVQAVCRSGDPHGVGTLQFPKANTFPPFRNQMPDAPAFQQTGIFFPLNLQCSCMLPICPMKSKISIKNRALLTFSKQTSG